MRALRALAAVLALAFLLLGIPWLLLLVGRPGALLTADWATSLTVAMDSSVLVGALSVAAWLAWAVLALTVVLEAVAVVTDLGHPTALVADHCRDLDLLALEANHDVQMLREGSYPPLLKARILSRVGHLSNAAMAELLERIRSPRLRSVVLAHLSEQNNLPELARFAAAEVLRDTGTVLTVACQRAAVAPEG